MYSTVFSVQWSLTLSTLPPPLAPFHPHSRDTTAQEILSQSDSSEKLWPVSLLLFLYSLGSSRDWCWDQLSASMVFLYHCYADDTSCTCFSPGWPLNLKLSLRHIRSTTTSNLTLLKLSCWFSQPSNPFITALTLKLRPSLLLPWRLFEIWSHDWWSTAFFWSCSLSLQIGPLHSTSEKSYHSWPNTPLSHWNKPWWDCD